MVTSQERLDDVLDSLEGKQVELARVQDRFPIRVDLLPSDIEEVTSRRVLDKTAVGQDALRDQLATNRHKLIANVRLNSATRAADPAEDDVLRLYPLVPYQVQLLIDAVSARRAHGGASPILGGSNRTIIKLAQQLVVDPRAGLGDETVGALVTIDRAYDLLESVIPTAWQSEVEQVCASTALGAPNLRRSKRLHFAATLAHSRCLRRTSESFSILRSMPSRFSPTSRLHVNISSKTIACGQETTATNFSPPSRRTGRRLDARSMLGPLTPTRIRRLVLKDVLAGLTVQRGKTFKIETSVEGEKLTDGDIALHIEEADTNRRADLRNLSREAAAKARVTWVFEESEDTYEAVLELHRSRSMIERKDTPSKTAAEVELLGEERLRLGRWERLVSDRLARDLAAGQIIFRGVIEDAPTGAARAAAQKAVADHIDEIYERIDQFSANLTGKDVLAVLHADNLDGIHPDLREDGIGLTHTMPQGEQVVTDRDPLLAVLTEIKDRAAYGNEATGKYLETEFPGRPTGRRSKSCRPSLRPVSVAGSSRSSIKVRGSAAAPTNG